MSRKQKAPKRPAEVVFAGKMESAFKTATVLIAKLQSMQRHKAVRSNDIMRDTYSRFVNKIAEKVSSCGPIASEVSAPETLESWVSQ